MKKIIYCILLTTFLAVSCQEEETKGISKVTYFPQLVVEGDGVVTVGLNNPYQDAGAVATESGQPIEVRTRVFGNYFESQVDEVNTSKPDKYTVEYAAENIDGFSASQQRQVFVAGDGDFVNSIEGLYTSTVVRNGVSSGQYTDMKYVIVKKLGVDQYQISDGIGGYYDMGRGYGRGYVAGPATLTYSMDDGSFVPGPSFIVGGFGQSASIEAFSVDPMAETITFTTSWAAGFTFVVTLKKVNF